MLAQALPTNHVDPVLLFEMLRIMAWVIGIGGVLMSSTVAFIMLTKRKPSADVAFATMEQSIEGIEATLVSINKRLDDGAKVHNRAEADHERIANLERGLGNTARPEDIHNLQGQMHELSVRLNALPSQIKELIIAAKAK